MSDLNRRTFLAGAGSGVAALALHGKARAASPNEQLRVAIIGVGGTGHGRGKDHIKAFGGRKDVTVATLCDVDNRVFGDGIKLVTDRGGKEPATVTDLRRVFDDKSIDAVSIATPNHWHALATVWACQAGKDVYVEKPVSHNFAEGAAMVKASRKYDRIVQTGTQNRSLPGVQEAVGFLRKGGIGKIFLAKGLCFNPRGSIGIKADAPVPPGVDYNVWLGPAPERPFNPNRFHYEWHWNWDYGNGDLGNQGIHQMDVARWGLGKETWPTKIQSSGGRFGYKDDGETPNTLISTYAYDDCELIFEVRGLPSNPEQGVKVGNLYYGTDGYLAINGGNWASFLGPKGEPGPKGDGKQLGGDPDHFSNFIKAVRERKREVQTADIVEGHRSTALCHLGNIAYRTGRSLTFDPQAENFGADAQANAQLTREYRSPFTLPDLA
ncbi:Gfo/Idh/MocA family oxidoreductase [Isosphaeraceae bacterium EP7]